jgi:hypothetical protein
VNALEKPYGYEVVAQMSDGSQKMFHYVGTIGQAKRKTVLRPHVRQVISATPVTWEQWLRAYGDPRIRM